MKSFLIKLNVCFIAFYVYNLSFKTPSHCYDLYMHNQHVSYLGSSMSSQVVNFSSNQSLHALETACLHATLEKYT